MIEIEKESLIAEEYEPLPLIPIAQLTNTGLSMQARLRVVMAVTALVYSFWLSVGLSVRHQFGGLEILANVCMGLILGVLFIYLTDTLQSGLMWQDLAANIIVSALFFAVFALFSTRQFVWAYMGLTALRGALFGLTMWILGYTHIGMSSNNERKYFIAAFMLLAGLFLSPVLANYFFNGAIFFVIAVGVRLAGSLILTRMDALTQGFLFGMMVGLCSVLIPFIGYYGYGLF